MAPKGRAAGRGRGGGRGEGASSRRGGGLAARVAADRGARSEAGEADDASKAAASSTKKQQEAAVLLARDDDGDVRCRRNSCSASIKDTPWGITLKVPKKGGKFETVPCDTIDACSSCYTAYMMGKQVEGPWSVVADECNASPAKEQEFEILATNVQDPAKRAFICGQVHVNTIAGMRAAIRHRGLRPWEFKEVFEKEIAGLNVPLKDLLHPDGSQYKGILVIDNGTRDFKGHGVLYEWFREISTQWWDVKMSSNTQMCQEQGASTFKYFTTPKDQEESMMKKLRNCTLDPQAILDMIAKPGPQVDAEGDGGTRGEDGEEDDDEPEGLGPIVAESVYQGAVLHPAVVPQAASSMKGGKRQSSARKSTAGESVMTGSRKKAKKGASADDLRDDLGSDSDAVLDANEIHIRNVDCDTILSGDRLGHKRRRLRDVMQDLGSDKDGNDLVQVDSATQAIISRMQTKLDIADVAETLSNVKSIAGMKKEKLNEKIDKVKMYVTAWPTDVQVALVKKTLGDMGECMLSDSSCVKEMLRTITLWTTDSAGTPLRLAATGAEITVGMEFDPKHPALIACQGSPKTMSNNYQKIFANFVMAPLFDATPGAEETVQSVLECIEAELVNAQADLDSHVGDAVYSCLTAARGCLYLLRPSDTEHETDFNKLTMKYPEEEWHACVEVFNLMKTKESWMNMYRDVKKTAPTHTDNVKAAADWEAKLTGATSIQEKSSLLHDAFHAIPGFVKKTRATSTKPLEKAFTKAMSDVAKHILNIDPAKIPPESVAESVQIMRGYTAAWGKGPPAAKYLLAEVTQGMQAAATSDESIPVLLSIQSARELAPRLHSIDPKKFLDEAVRSECVDMVKGFLKHCVEMQPSVDVQTKAAQTIKMSMEHVMANASRDMLVTCQPAWSALCDLLAPALKQKWGVIRKVFVECDEVLKRVTTLNAAWTAEGAERSSIDPELTECKAVHSTLVDVLASCQKYSTEVDLQSLIAECTANVDIVKGIATAKANAMSQRMHDYLAEPIHDNGPLLKDVLGGASKHDEVWSEGLSAKAAVKEIKRKASSSLYKLNTVEFTKALGVLKKQYDEYITLSEFFSNEIFVKESVDDTRAKLSRGYATVLEGCLLFNFEQKDSPAQKKTAVNSSMTKYNIFEAASRVHDAIQSCVKKVMEMKPLA